jgi:hypothetical protein
MKSYRLLFLLPLICFLTACPYSSAFKVGEPQEIDNIQWDGTWISSRIENGKMIKDELIFKKSGKQVMNVNTAFHVLRADRSSKLKLKGYPVKIGGQNWLLLYNPKRNSDKKYMYLGYEFSASNTLLLKILSDTKVPEDLTSPTALEAWILANQKDSGIWEDTLQFQRLGYLEKKP